MSVQGFHTIVLQVSDLERSIEFYEAALRRQFTLSDPDGYVLEFLGPVA